MRKVLVNISTAFLRIMGIVALTTFFMLALMGVFLALQYHLYITISVLLLLTILSAIIVWMDK